MEPTFVIRDDDLNYFSTPEDIQRWYKDVLAQNIPVGFSTIPFVKPISDVYTAGYNDENKEYTIAENKELIEYVKSNPLIEILQHGCTHETKDGVFEYMTDGGLYEKTKRGKAELERAFNRDIKVFVAPHDSINVHGVLAVEKSGMDIIRGRGSKTFMWRAQYIPAILKMILHKVLHPRKLTMPAYPYVLDLGKHKEAYSYRLEAAKRDFLRTSLEYVQKKGGCFILVNHVHFCNEERRELMLETIAYARELGFKFVYPRDLFT